MMVFVLGVLHQHLYLFLLVLQSNGEVINDFVLVIDDLAELGQSELISLFVNFDHFIILCE